MSEENEKDGKLPDARSANEMRGEEELPPDDAVAPELEKARRERDEYLELARRARADYQNLQKRSEAQAAAVRKEAQQRFALDVIAVLDDLERAIEHARGAPDAGGFLKGMELVRQNFLAVLAGYGIAPIEADGQAFDHNLHHAIAEQPTEDVPAGAVVAVAQTGYTADGKLLRPAQVVVARGFEESSGEETKEGLVD